ncbi:hypothetical protein [Methylobacterium oryzae]|uniref:Carboxypeptidase regulatory-like domain-containing protein n=1 Tax=Methylobacterium oryzae TaxID=334852 RepID=A0ABU7TW83_9HYPH
MLTSFGTATLRAVSRLPGAGAAGNVDTTGRTVLRGSQTTGPEGWVRLETIYPGRYAACATHVPVKAFLDGRTMLTGQIDLPDAPRSSAPRRSRPIAVAAANAS